MEQELYKLRSVSSCIKTAFDTVCNNAKTIIRHTWLAALVNALVMAACPVVYSQTAVGISLSCVLLLAAIVTNAFLFSKIVTLLNGRKLMSNFKRFLAMSATMAGCGLLATIITVIASILILQSTTPADMTKGITMAYIVSVVIFIISGAALLPAAYSSMNYLYNEESRWSNIFGSGYKRGCKSWGYLFMLHLLLAIIVTILYIPLFIIPITMMMADFSNASCMALGDADALPAGFKLIYYVASAISMWLMSYVIIWGHIAVYYAYGNIETKLDNKQTQNNNE